MLALLMAVTAINALIATGLALVGVLFPSMIVRDGEGSHTANTFALYSLARSAVLLLAILWAGFRADLIALIWLGLVAGLTQLADATIGTRAGGQLKIWTPLVLGGIQLLVVRLAFLWA